MAAHSLLTTALGTGAVLLAMAGVSLALRPRRLWAWWFRWERRWRLRRFGGGWAPLERALRGRGYFWVPRDVSIRSPDDIYAYAQSDRFWRSPYAWLVRALCWYAGSLLIFFSSLLLGFGLPSLP